LPDAGLWSSRLGGPPLRTHARQFQGSTNLPAHMLRADEVIE
jgi:hypothetical protein